MSEASPSPRDVVQRQLAAYNARDLAAFAALFADDVVVRDYHETEPRVRGIDQLRTSYGHLFERCANLKCEANSIAECGAFVIVHEMVEGLTDHPLKVVAIYEIKDGHIRSLEFLWPTSCEP